MAELPRLNGVIRALEAGQHRPDLLRAGRSQPRGRHEQRPNTTAACSRWSTIRGTAALLRDCLQYMLNRAQIAKAASVVPGVTPMVRIPVNGVEMAQWQAKQALDMGCYGIVFPHISTVEEAANAVGACRYPRLKSASALRAARHPRRRPDHGGAILGPRPAGILPEGRRLAAQSARARFSASCRSRTPAASRTSTTCSRTCRASAAS